MMSQKFSQSIITCALVFCFTNMASASQAVEQEAGLDEDERFARLLFGDIAQREASSADFHVRALTSNGIDINTPGMKMVKHC